MWAVRCGPRCETRPLVPQARGVGGAGEDDERAAAREEDREAAKGGLDGVLVDTGLVQPDERMLGAVVAHAVRLRPLVQPSVLHGAVVLPAVRDEAVDVAERRRLCLAVEARVGRAAEVGLGEHAQRQRAEALPALVERLGRRAAADERRDARRLLLLRVLRANVAEVAMCAPANRGREDAGDDEGVDAVDEGAEHIRLVANAVADGPDD